MTKSHLVRPLAVIHATECREPADHRGRGRFSPARRGSPGGPEDVWSAKGQWTIPSGYVERHESIVDNIEREVKEETNVVGRAGPILAVRNRVTETANDTFLIFRVTYTSGEPKPDHDEVSEAAFQPLSDLAEFPDSAAFTRAIIRKLEVAPGLRADPYRPPPESGGHLEYLLYL
jgi:ADP-ribose pyrophosphatase YjhB (NUDIX family)